MSGRASFLVLGDSAPKYYYFRRLFAIPPAFDPLENFILLSICRPSVTNGTLDASYQETAFWNSVPKMGKVEHARARDHHPYFSVHPCP
jgi:hypothetical protein